MFSYSQFSRWLETSVDPLTVEDWLANREVFGPVEKPNVEEKELERVFQLETEKVGDGGARGVYEDGNFLLICACGKRKGEACSVEWNLGKEKLKRLIVSSSLALSLSPDVELKLKIRCRNGFKISGGNEFSWQGTGKTKVIIDVVNQ
jgi:hypothetical protein